LRELPSGTVSLLFSDIEGSTLLLSRLGPSYADALDGHRQVLRSAWAAHGGTEMGTEGDSFFVVFRTAEGAVRAAVQAQRGLESYPWPGGERVRVRIGIHTGTPQVHEDDYVGMDVHRAARIAASAHGGQVVLSSVAAELARDGLPEGVGLSDLGSHHLKDIPEAERLFQLCVEGLQDNFPAPKSLGASSSLPIPTTHLVGREPTVAELADLVQSPDVRLVTLTGPGGSGKTRLAIEVARKLATTFPDGVFFVPLASVTSADVMWTSIADVLDLPRSARMPPGLLEQVAHRAALFVLDNLEQLNGADDVVTQLLAAVPRAAVVASSRRALGVPGEHLYPVPPLALPAGSTLANAEASPAVQLFIQQARSVRPDFQLTDENVADVVAICHRLDGLPLAVELSAARIRLLSPQALLRRIDQTLDVASMSRQGPPRQRTLRDTIAWSYHLLPDTHQEFFRRLGVFAGGADLEAVSAVAGPVPAGDQPADPLDLVAGLVDASLVLMSEAPDGEPRIMLLETIRSFARRELRAAGERDDARSAHAMHYVQVAERLRVLRDSEHLLALRQAETELDNFREALAWAMRRESAPERDDGAGTSIDLRLSSSLGWLWYMGGYVVEGRRWLERALERAGGPPSAELADCLGTYANLLIAQGESERACEFAMQSLVTARTVADEEREAFAMGVLGTAQLQRGDADSARQTFEEALTLHRRIGNQARLTRALGNLAGVEEELGNYQRAEELTHEALAIVRAAGDLHEAAVQGQNLANLLAVAGRADEASQMAQSLIESVLQLRSPNLTMAFANTCMNILIRLGDPIRAAHLLGAEEAMRDRLSLPNPHQEEEHVEAWTAVKGLISAEDWELQIQTGREASVEDLLAGLSNG
jgi:predicted ATPase/class 3 adenylate cyclase